MKAAVFHGPGSVTVEDVPDPECHPGDVVLRVAGCGICGSDLHSYTHGSFVEPGQVMGHELAGTVVEVGTAVTGIVEGDRLTVVPILACHTCPRCLEGRFNLCETGLASSIAYGLPGGFAEYLRVPGAVLGGSVYRVPDGVALEHAALAEPVSVALHAAVSTTPGPDDLAVVIGLGSIGQTLVQVLKAMGVLRVVGIDVAAKRLQTAAEHGADVTIDASAEDPLQVMRDLTGPGAYDVGARADITFECSGVPKMLDQAIQMTRSGGTVRITALYDGAVPIDATAVVQKELDLGGSFAYRGEFGPALALLEAGRINPEALISHTFGIDDITQAFDAQLDKAASVKVMVRP